MVLGMLVVIEADEVVLAPAPVFRQEDAGARTSVLTRNTKNSYSFG